MSKKMLLGALIIATGIATKTNAQLRDNLSLGPLLGFGHSWSGHNNYGSGTSQKFNPSFNGGARLVYSATPNFGFGLDGTFRTEGNKVESGNFKSTSHLNYLQLDPKIYYFFGKYGQALRPKIGVGPNFGFLLGGKTKASTGTTVTEMKAKDLYNGFNFGLAGSLGFNYRIKSKVWLNVDAVYNHGFSDITKDISDPQSRSIFLNVGVTFGIGHVESKGEQRNNRTRK